MKQKLTIIDTRIESYAFLKSVFAENYEVEIYENGDDFIESIHLISTDLILIDINLCESNSYELCSFIKTIDALKKTPIIFYGSKIDTVSKKTCYDLGAINVIERPLDLYEIKAIVKSTLNYFRESFGQEIKFKNNVLDFNRLSIRTNNNELRLTRQQFKVLSYFFKNPNTVISRTTIIELLSSKDICPRTIDNTISKIRKLLKDTDLKINSIYGEGYLLDSA